MTANNSWTLSPSDFAFLWEECKRCFWLKVVTGFRRPSPPMPKIFTRIDLAMKQTLAGRRVQDILQGFTPGVLEYSDKWVTSLPLYVGDSQASSCVLRGRFDTVIRFDRGGFGVVDFKTCDRNESHIPLYARQLHAYALALEQAAPGRFTLAPVRRLGLLVFEPKTFAQSGVDVCALNGGLNWIEVERDDEKFFAFLREVTEVLNQANPPEPDETCDWCRYREAAVSETTYAQTA